MNINSKDIIAGQPILKIRELLKFPGPWTIDYVIEKLNVGKSTAKKVIATLEEEGYINPLKGSSREKWWTNTLMGNSLALASAAKPITRATADKKLSEFLERVKVVNQNDIYAYKVKQVLVFGSYLSNKERISDVDIAIELVPRENDRERQTAIERERIKEAHQHGRCFNHFLDELLWPRQEVLKFLKSRSRSISIHPIDDAILKQVEYRVLFEESN